MKVDRYTILHRKDERGVIVDSGVFGPDDEIPEGFGAAEYTKVDPVTAQKREVDEPKSTPWSSPIAKGTWVEQPEPDEVTEALESDEDGSVEEPDESDEGSPRQAREDDLTGAEKEADETLESDEDDSGDEAEPEVDAGSPVQVDDSTVSAPPQGGPGSGKEAWAQYAAAQGVTVPEDASRDEIISAVKAAGKPVD